MGVGFEPARREFTVGLRLVGETAWRCTRINKAITQSAEVDSAE